MIHYYRHRSKNILLRVFSENITLKDIHYFIEIEEKILNSTTEKFISIAYFYKDYKVVDKHITSVSADFTNLYQSKFKHSYFVGLVGINKLFLNVFTRLAAKNYPREIFDNLQDVAIICGFSYPSDFEEIKLVHSKSEASL